MQVWLLIINSVAAASFSVLTICLVGAYLFSKRIIDEHFTKLLSGLIERVFLPSLIITNFLRSVTLAQFLELIPVVISAFIVCFTGYGVGLFSSRYWIKEPRFEGIVTLACSNPHTTNIQLQISQSLLILLDELTQHLGYQTNVDSTTRAITAVMLFTTISNSLRWTVFRQMLMNFASADRKHKQKEIEMALIQGNSESPIKLEPLQTEDLTFMQKIRSIISMPLISIGAAFSIMCVPEFQAYLIDRRTFLCRALFTPFFNIGRALTPLVLIMLGANICLIIEKGGFRDNINLPKPVLAKITFSRLVILPSVGMMIIIMMYRTSFLTDPASLFVVFITFASPSAINILVMAKQYTDCEDLASLVLLFSYLSAIATLPIWSMIFFSCMFYMGEKKE